MIVGALGLALLILSAIMHGNAKPRPVQRNPTVELDGLPQGSRRLKVELLSDSHVSDFGNTPERGASDPPLGSSFGGQ